jgi:Raf kinase inhibitor-like YbhB/YbcL family protein
MANPASTLSNVGKLIRHAIGAALSPMRAGDEQIASPQPATAWPKTIKLTSESLLPNQPIPDKFTPQAQDISPALSWSGVPEGTRELVLICEDPDAPMSRPFVHWILHRLPGNIMSLPPGVPKERELKEFGGAVQGRNGYKTRGWSGPQPPLGHGVHHYHFELFAIDTQLSLGPDATLDELASAMRGHVLAEGEIIGTYERRAK